MNPENNQSYDLFGNGASKDLSKMVDKDPKNTFVVICLHSNDATARTANERQC